MAELFPQVKQLLTGVDLLRPGAPCRGLSADARCRGRLIIAEPAVHLAPDEDVCDPPRTKINTHVLRYATEYR